MTPNGHLAGLANHTVVENADGTITVTPSIRVFKTYNGKEVTLYHGRIERGYWK